MKEATPGGGPAGRRGRCTGGELAVQLHCAAVLERWRGAHVSTCALFSRSFRPR
jgi:hypothetical protein